jgi:hypothetical protein
MPASRLREVNCIFETAAWGAYRTEFYPTYDYKPIGIANHEKAKQVPQAAANQGTSGAVFPTVVFMTSIM